MAETTEGEAAPMDPKSLMALARQYAPLLALLAGLAGGGTTMKFWDQEQMDRMEQREIQQGQRLDTAIDQLNRFQGSLDACLQRPALTDMPADYYRGRDQIERPHAADPNEAANEEEVTP